MVTKSLTYITQLVKGCDLIGRPAFSVVSLKEGSQNNECFQFTI